MEDTKKYNAKFAACILSLVALFIAILLASTISDRIIPTDIYSDKYFDQDVLNKALGTKIFFICWGVQVTGIFIWYIKKERGSEE